MAIRATRRIWIYWFACPTAKPGWGCFPNSVTPFTKTPAFSSSFASGNARMAGGFMLVQEGTFADVFAAGHEEDLTDPFGEFPRSNTDRLSCTRLKTGGLNVF